MSYGLVLLVLVGAGVVIRYRNDRRTRVGWRGRVAKACHEALVLVDLAAPPPAGGPIALKELSAIEQRLDRLEERLTRLGIPSSEHRTAEAAADLRHVVQRLSATLEANRAVRVVAGSPAKIERSTARISEQVAELDLAAQELSWLAESE